MKTSESVKTIAAALLKVQKTIKHAKKDSSNPHFKSTYADLESVWEACREQLHANGIVVLQSPGGDGQSVTLTTRLMHESGEWMEGTMYLPAQQQSPQGWMSALTYARRGALAAWIGIIPSDDDGEAAEGRGWGAPAPRREAQAPGNVRPAARPPQTSGPATTGHVFPPYGNAKGQPIAGATLGTLEFYAGGCRKTLENPAKAQWHDKERTLLAAIEAEMIRQGAPPEEFQGQEADDVNF
jgi:hypothetical protein